MEKQGGGHIGSCGSVDECPAFSYICKLSVSKLSVEQLPI